MLSFPSLPVVPNRLSESSYISTFGIYIPSAFTWKIKFPDPSSIVISPLSLGFEYAFLDIIYPAVEINAAKRIVKSIFNLFLVYKFYFYKHTS